jgi:hypothetical protein
MREYREKQQKEIKRLRSIEAEINKRKKGKKG